MLYTLARQTYQSIKGETEAERKEARKALAAVLAMHATFAGALGLPGVWFIMAIASAWGGDDDEPWDAEVALRNYLAEAFNPTISNMLIKALCLFSEWCPTFIGSPSARKSAPSFDAFQ